jgi:uncharacterized protein YjbI with pentapeptide repeats
VVRLSVGRPVAVHVERLPRCRQVSRGVLAAAGLARRRLLPAARPAQAAARSRPGAGSKVGFTGARFSGGTVDFGAAEFTGGTVVFTAAKLFSGGRVDFDAAEFSGGTVRFTGAEFSGGTVRFSGAEFSGGTVGFEAAEFTGGTVDFTSFPGARFSGGTVDLSNARDWSHPPRFDLEGTLPPGVKLPKKEDQSQA